MPAPRNSNDRPAVTLKQAIDNFLADTAAGHSAATAATYKIGLSRFTFYLKFYLQLDPLHLPVADLQPDWAVDCVRWIAAGQPAPEKSAEAAPDKKVEVSKRGVKKDSNSNNNQPTPVQPAPKTTTATYVAALTRFYRWAARERLLILPADEYERMTERIKDLRGKIKRTILSKVPAQSVIERLLAQARVPYSTGPDKADSDTNATSPTTHQVEVEEAHSSGLKGGRGRVQTKLERYDQTRYELLRLRNIALLETLKSSGARVSEICSLTRGDLDVTNRRAHVIGKGSKERWLYFSTVAWECVEEYLAARTKLMREFALRPATGANPLSQGDGQIETEKDGGKRQGRRSTGGRHKAGLEIANEPVFARHDRGAGLRVVKSLTPHAVQQLLWGLVEAAGLEVVITPHKFRHWFATQMLSTTGDLAATQDLLGHASPNTTRIYAQVSEQRKQDLHHQVFG